MDRLSAEKRLTLCYLLSVLFAIVSCVSTGIVWGHWYKTLDQCINRNCSCILYATHTPSMFLGGEQAPCIWTTFGPLLFVFFSIGLICFHGYRVLFAYKSPMAKPRTTRAMLSNREDSVVHIQTSARLSPSTLPSAYWVTVQVYTLLITIYMLIHFGIFMDGYYSTCNQYRKALERLLAVHGSALPVIYNRLSCVSVFDFMDYMQLDSGRAYRDGFINTGLALSLGLAGSCMASALNLFATVMNFKLYKLHQEDE